MKFKNSLSVCRNDEDVPLMVIMNYKSIKCYNNIKGKCELDGKTCEQIKYKKVKK